MAPQRSLCSRIGGGSIRAKPDWVDYSKPPGHTSQNAVTEEAMNDYFSISKWIKVLLGYEIVFTENLIWCIIAVVLYFVFPFDLHAAARWDFNYLIFRAILNVTVCLGYIGFWHYFLYIYNGVSRPFQPNRSYNIAKVMHNVYYTVLGALQWTLWEVAVMHLYGTGKLPYISDTMAFANMNNTLRTLLGIILVPIYREVHFYFTHRFIHFKGLYKYVHSLHHRVTDIEPFAGLSMHPIEHLYYYTSVLPHLLLYLHPLGFYYNGIHLILSPAASHSGWEDHWQSDQYHYLHHRFFECNYATGGLPLDKWFGTFRDKLTKIGSSASVADARANLVTLPSWDVLFYNASMAMLAGFVAQAIYTQSLVMSIRDYALLAALGPLVCSQILCFATDSKLKSIWTPFHKDHVMTKLVHVLLALFFATLPVYVLVHDLLAPHQADSWYHRLH